MNVHFLAQDAARRGPLLIVFNAGSGHHNIDDEQAVMARVFTQAGRAFEFLPIDEPGRIDEVARHAVRLAKARGGVVVAAGGDGTINAVARAVLGSGCPFGVLPQGTFNYFGRVHAIPQETEAAANALVGASVSPVQVGQVNGRLFLVNASLGLYPRLLEDREAWKQQFGRSRLVAFVSGLASLLQTRRQLHLQIESAGQVAALRTPTLFVGNNHLQLTRVGIAEKDANAVINGQLAGVVVRPIGSLALFGLMLRGLLGRLGDADNIRSFSFRRLTVTPRGRRRVKVATDGEVCWMEAPLVFEVADQALLLMVPAPADRVDVA
ncbi:diacylglycerol kinase family protein [Polaromonas sp.]|uniref:diacylglycerol/lipid kinase family protein n=1 Tax=Polaromonas sp. TaxID=1869339 RepID=UPI00248A53B7|nr:diacylglycerol kinase family protein [Polaromonas sp.]MDI1340813.1 diacylglycerol kinase family protein [Polaromonas sp.]